MSNNIKLAFFDLDGTLTNNEKEISLKNIKALEYLKNKGIKLVYASGRWDSYILTNNYHTDLIDYIICNNGAEIYDIKNKKLLLSNYMNNNTVKLLLDYCNKLGIQITFNSYLKRFDNNITNEELINNPIYLGVVICKTKDEVNKIINEIDELEELYISYISAAYFKDIEAKSYTLNINIRNVDKGSAVKYLQEYLNINKEECVSFGDNNNDIPMFNNCGTSVAMENGYSVLKEQATYITKTNDEDGVAYFIDNYL